MRLLDLREARCGQLSRTEGNLRLLTLWEQLSVYQWGSRTARDYFCRTCGILPFRRPSDPTSQEIEDGVQPFDGWAVNVRCLDGMDLEQLPITRIYGSRIRVERAYGASAAASEA